MKEGDGFTFPEEGQTVIFHLAISSEDGTLINSTRAEKRLYSSVVDGSKAFLYNGVKEMTKGERATFTIPLKSGSVRGTGTSSRNCILPENTRVIYDIELADIE